MHNELTQKDLQLMREELDYRRVQLRPKLLEAVKEARACPGWAWAPGASLQPSLSLTLPPPPRPASFSPSASKRSWPIPRSRSLPALR